MNILITGAAGFVGSHLRNHFVKLGHRVVGTIHPAEKASEGFYPIDLALPVTPESLPGGMEFVIHCASQQPRPNLKLEDYERGNVLTLQNILGWMAATGVKNVIHFSSAVVYGNTEAAILTEETPISPQNDYALSKSRSEKVLEDATARNNLTSVCFRMPSVFGVGQIGGIAHTYYEHAVNHKDLEIFAEGKLLRNLLHIDDIVKACEKTAEHLKKFSGTNLFLLGSRDSLTMLEIAELILKKTGSRQKITLVNQPAPFNFHWNFSIDKLKNSLDFCPMSIEEGLTRYIEQMGESHAR